MSIYYIIYPLNFKGDVDMKKHKEIIEARSIRNGIIFRSNTFGMIGTEALLHDDGTIHTRTIPMELYEQVTYPLEKTTLSKWKIFGIDILIIFLIFILTKNIQFVLATIYFSIFNSVDFFLLIKYSYKLKSKKSKRYSLGKFHAAEHMVINAYEKLQRVPTIEEIKNFSRFSKYCGSTDILFKITLYTIISLIIVFSPTENIFFSLIIIGIVYFILNILKKLGVLNFLQILVTNKPNNKELELAIEGVKSFETLEKKLNRLYHTE